MFNFGWRPRRGPAKPRRARTINVGGAAADRPLEARLMMAADVLTYHNDNMRVGLNSKETTLTPANVNSATFGKIGQAVLDGSVQAQPLVKTGVRMPDRTTRDLVFVATEHDSVYALDAKTLAVVWRKSLIDPARGITTVPTADVKTAAVKPELGITGTPVI